MREYLAHEPARVEEKDQWEKGPGHEDRCPHLLRAGVDDERDHENDAGKEEQPRERASPSRYVA
jgi:hypothetical protein